MKEMIMGVVRHVLTTGGGFLVAQGVATEADAQALAGGILALIGVIASVIAKRK